MLTLNREEARLGAFRALGLRRTAGGLSLSSTFLVMMFGAVDPICMPCCVPLLPDLPSDATAPQDPVSEAVGGEELAVDVVEGVEAWSRGRVV